MKEKLAKKLENLVTSYNKEDIKKKLKKVETIERDNGFLEVRTVEIGEEQHPTEPNKYTFDIDMSKMTSTAKETATGRKPKDEEVQQWFDEHVVIPKEPEKRWDFTTWFYIGHHEDEDKFPFISIEGTIADSLINEFYSREFETKFQELLSRLNYENETHITFKKYA